RPHRDGLPERLAVLPAVLRPEPGPGPDGQDGLRPDAERLGVFKGVDDLARFGYPRVEPVRGMRLASPWGPCADPRAVPAVVPPAALRAERLRRFRPRYLPRAQRMPRADAEAVLERSFPGINHAYVRLLIAARGCAEAGDGQPPMVAVDGPSGSGKSLTVQVA